MTHRCLAKLPVHVGELGLSPPLPLGPATAPGPNIEGPAAPKESDAAAEAMSAIGLARNACRCGQGTDDS